MAYITSLPTLHALMAAICLCTISDYIRAHMFKRLFQLIAKIYITYTYVFVEPPGLYKHEVMYTYFKNTLHAKPI